MRESFGLHIFRPKCIKYANKGSGVQNIQLFLRPRCLFGTARTCDKSVKLCHHNSTAKEQQKE